MPKKKKKNFPLIRTTTLQDLYKYITYCIKKQSAVSMFV